MKFKAAVIVSVIFHLSIFAIALYVPGKGGKSGTVYYVDLINMPGGGGKGGAGKGGGNRLTAEPQKMKDLTVKKEEPQSKLRYPDKNNKKKNNKKKKKEKKRLISVVKKDRKRTEKNAPLTTVTRKQGRDGKVLTTGISAGSGGGSGGGYGSGSGNGYGDGSGIGGGSFPYAYYIAALKNKISSSWYNALISPGMRGRYIATVYFKIMRNGQIRDLELSGKSGVKALDLSARRAIENAAPFPPLPGDYPDYYLGVYFEFVWEKK